MNRNNRWSCASILSTKSFPWNLVFPRWKSGYVQVSNRTVEGSSLTRLEMRFQDKPTGDTPTSRLFSRKVARKTEEYSGSWCAENFPTLLPDKRYWKSWKFEELCQMHEKLQLPCFHHNVSFARFVSVSIVLCAEQASFFSLANLLLVRLRPFSGIHVCRPLCGLTFSMSIPSCSFDCWFYTVFY